MHEFQDDGDGFTCTECPLPRGNKVHLAANVPVIPAPRSNVHGTVSVALDATATSAAAAEKALPKSSDIKGRIIDLLAAASAYRGMTDEEILAALADVSPNSARPRRRDLVTDGWVCMAYDEAGSAVQRPTGSGALANAWTLSPGARARMGLAQPQPEQTALALS